MDKNSQEIDAEEETREESAEETLQDGNVGEEAEPEMDLPSALAKLEEANRKIRDVNRESASRRKEIAELKARLAGAGTNENEVTTQLTELQGQLNAANEKLRTFTLRDMFDLAATKAKIPFINQTAARDAFAFAQDQLSKLPEDAADEDVTDIIKDVVKLRPYLLNKPTSPNINSEAKGATDVLSALNMDDIARDFGIISH